MAPKLKLPCWSVLFLAYLTLACLVPTAQASAATKKAADEADKHIQFLKHEEVATAIKKDVWFLLFGANWCPYTQRFTPKWLKVQEEVIKQNLPQRGLHMAKIECSTGQHRSSSPFCTGTHQIEGFPTVMMYVDGKLRGEYPEEDEVKPLLRYMTLTLQEYEQTKAKLSEAPLSPVSATAPTKQAPQAIQPSKEVPQPVAPPKQAPQPISPQKQTVEQKQASQPQPQPEAPTTAVPPAGKTSTTGIWIFGGAATVVVGAVLVRRRRRSTKRETTYRPIDF
ncbi:hypothetical protein HDU85_006990 [Gaertneriomyces sp. JEL0708]|nr:hypothetical protein HDU85_006990 [Gaertneriomyces sp. JEL0708]